MPGGAIDVCVAGAEWPSVERAIDLEVTRIVAESRDAVRDAVAEGAVDCVLVGSGLRDATATDVLESVRAVDPELPVVCWPDDVDAAEASAAVRHGATEYLPEAEAETVADRIAAALEDADQTFDVGFAAFGNSLPEAVFVLDESGTVTYASEATRNVFGYLPDELEGGVLDRVISDGSTEAYRDSFADVVDAGRVEREWDDVELPAVDAAGEEFDVALSLGAFVLGGDRFVGATVRDVDDRRRRERALTSLNESMHRLMDAQHRDEVAEIAVETAGGVLGLSINAVFRYCEESGRLEPAAWTDETEAVVGEPPSLGLDDSLAGAAFERGEPKTYRYLRDESDRYNPDTPFESEMILPIGDHGVLVVGDTDAGAFDEVDETLARILAANVETALSRAARERTLRRYRSAIESVQDLLFAMDDEGRIVLVTEALADLLGYERDELVGSSIDALLTRTGIEEGLVLVNHLLAEESRGHASYETVLEPSDGDPVPVEIELSLMDGEAGFGGVVGVVRDRSEIERTRQELATARERFTYLFDHIPDALVDVEFVDGEPVVGAVNPAFEDVFGYDPDEVVGSSINDYVLTDDLRDSGRSIDERTSAGAVTTARVRRKTTDGMRDFLFRGIPYDAEGESVRCFGIYTDITEQTERERRLGVLTNVLRHNLRTEMNLVLAHADAIVEAEPGDRVAELAAELRQSAEAVVELGETARDLEALIERTWGTGTSVDLAGLVRSVIAELTNDHPSASIETDLPEESPVVGDEALRRALLELVENAIVHADAPATVEVSVEPVNDEWVELLIADDGPGIPAFERELLAGDREVTQLQHGSGLGLWIAQWTVESLGGSLALIDRGPDGTVARVTLRRA